MEAAVKTTAAPAARSLRIQGFDESVILKKSLLKKEQILETATTRSQETGALVPLKL
jgi:hypothetical protein